MSDFPNLQKSISKNEIELLKIQTYSNLKLILKLQSPRAIKNISLLPEFSSGRVTLVPILNDSKT